MKRNELSRREFLRLSAGLIGSTALLTACVVQQQAAPAEQAGEPAGAEEEVKEAPAPAAEAGEITVIGRAVTIPTILTLAEQWMKDTGIKVTPLEIGGD